MSDAHIGIQHYHWVSRIQLHAFQKEGNVLFYDAHFIYGYVISEMLLRKTLMSEETHCHHFFD